MKTNTKLSIVAIMVFTFAISACKKDKKELPKVDEPELITTIKLTFTNTNNAADVKTFAWKDLDGQGGAAPMVDTIKLAANTNYNLEITEILNETATPVENVTEEIEEENYEHLFVYKPSASLLTVAISDKDKNKLPVGLMAVVNTNTAKTGTLRIVLRHQKGVKDGTEAPGSTDFDITYPVKIK